MRKRTLTIALGLALLLTQAGWGQSEWKWLTGGKLNKVQFIGQEGWAVGDLGQIIHTTDGGEHWELQVSGTSNNLIGLAMPDAQNGWIIGQGDPRFFRTRDGGRIWNSEPSPPGGNAMVDICALDTLHLWITNGDSIIFTQDGGRTWQGTFMLVNCAGISFVDTLLGFTVSSGLILRSSDGGRTWPDTAIVPGPLFSIHMVNGMRGWTCYWPGLVYHTRDGWRTWVEQPIGVGGVLNDISFQDTMRGYLCGGDNNVPATIYRTTNAGATWLWDSTLARGNNAFYGIDGRFQPSGALTVGAAGGIVKTTDGGTTWRVIDNTDIGNRSLLNVAFRNVNQGWAVGTYGVITHTVNGGTVWTRQASGTQAFLWGVDFPTLQKGWACGESGTILATANGGTNWGQQTSNTTMPLFSIDFADTNTLVGVAVGGYYGPLDWAGEQGSRGAGEKHTPYPLLIEGKRHREMLNQVQHDEVRGLRNDTPWMQDTIKPWGTGPDFWKWPWNPQITQITQNPQTPYRTIIRTTNGGVLWIAVNSTGQVPLYGVGFVTPREGWACGDPQGGMGVILHTTDSGATWTGQNSNVNQTLNWIQFKNSQTGWSVGSGGTALWTTDGGNTWNQGNTGITSVLWSCAFYDNLNGFACGNNGLLIKTVDGGRNWTPDTSKVYANLMAVNALDSTHAWTVGSYGMVLGWREAGVSGVEQRGPDKDRDFASLNRIKAFPNPFVSFARVPGHEKERFVLFDITGRRVGTYAGEKIGADVASGIYFLMAVEKEGGPRSEGRPIRIVKVR